MFFVGLLLVILGTIIPIGLIIGWVYFRRRLVYRTRKYVPQISFADVGLDGDVPGYEHNMEWLNNIVIFILDQYWNAQTEDDIVLFMNTVIAGTAVDLKGIQDIKVKGLDLKTFRPGIASICTRRTTPTRVVVDIILELAGVFGLEVSVRLAGVKTNSSIILKNTLIPLRLVLDFANARGGDGTKRGDKGAVAPSLLTVPSEDGNKLTLLASLPLLTSYIPLPIVYDLKLKTVAPGVGTVLEQFVKTIMTSLEKVVMTMKCDGRVAMSAVKSSIGEERNADGSKPKVIKVKVQDNEGKEKPDAYAFKIEKGVPAELRKLDDTQLLQLVEANKKLLAKRQKAKRRRHLQGVQAHLTDNAGVRGVKAVGDKTWGGVSKVGHGIGRVVGLGGDRNRQADNEDTTGLESDDLSDSTRRVDPGERAVMGNNAATEGERLSDDEGSEDEEGHKTKNPFKKFKNHRKMKKEKEVS